MPRLLLVHHTPTPAVRSLADAVLAGARHPDLDDAVEVVERAALEASADDVLAADGVLLGTPANFGYMSGALKHFFDTIFLQAGGALADDGSAAGGTPVRRPFGLWVHGRYDTTGAERSVLAIVQALGWVQAAPVLAVLGEVGDAELEAAGDLGATLAAVLLD
ncbi:NAD(P)H-dependent oxidoreductase [Nocardioides fonticola]|uniref:NAD(P)H-dependent oxidoreductase n=1 Tax=Nocardioides fonticola TaxID=450363 RepID=A0ABP7X9M8_9ACTN